MKQTTNLLLDAKMMCGGGRQADAIVVLYFTVELDPDRDPGKIVTFALVTRDAWTGIPPKQRLVAQPTMATTDGESGGSVENDLPNLTTDCKRGYDNITQDRDLVESSNSTPQKRPKRSAGSEVQGVRYSDLSIDNNGAQSRIALSGAENANPIAVSSSIDPANESRAAPSINWNVGTKAKIRTSLGGISRQANVQALGEEETQEQTKTQSPIQARGLCNPSYPSMLIQSCIRSDHVVLKRSKKPREESKFFTRAFRQGSMTILSTSRY